MSRSSQPVTGLPSQSLAPALQVGTHAEVAQLVVPKLLAHTRPHSPQLSGSEVRSKPSSIIVSQSSSALLHCSIWVPVLSLQRVPPVPGSHSIVPSTQASPSVPSHGMPTSNPSSVVASQSSFMLLQVSTVELVTSLHTTLAPSTLHMSMPSTQTSVSAPSQAMPTPGKPSSIVPSQSSSIPLHVSRSSSPVAQVVPTPEAAHTITSSGHMSESGPSQAVPRVGKASSIMPLQLSSTPLHSSGPGTHASSASGLAS